jgi:manganese/zinc/iron transport system permease protein
MPATTIETLWRVILLQDHNTRVVLAGSCVFGAAAGLVGTFLLLRKRSLLGDTLGHATLPGIAGAFLIAITLGVNARSFLWLSIGAAVSGIAGMLTVLGIRKFSRIKDDAALAIVLSVFFGTGVALLSAIQQLPGGQAAGIEGFIYGNTASMTTQDAGFIFAASLFVVVACVAFFKEFSLLCFDEAFASTTGWPVRTLDLFLMSLIVLVTVIGLQSVGILLVVALLVIPPVAARFWSDNLRVVAFLATIIGADSAIVGVVVSSVLPKMPAGAIIVLVAATIFAFGFLFGTRRGVIIQLLAERRAASRLRSEHMLRAVYECAENQSPLVELTAILNKRPWQKNEVLREIHRLANAELLTITPDGLKVQLTSLGQIDSRRLVRNHRLWELYLLNHADVAPGRVDRDADMIEHVLDPRLVDELEVLLAMEGPRRFVPLDPEKRKS